MVVVGTLYYLASYLLYWNLCPLDTHLFNEETCGIYTTNLQTDHKTDSTRLRKVCSCRKKTTKFVC